MTPTTDTTLTPDTPVPADVAVVGQWETSPETGDTARRLNWISEGTDGIAIVTACTQTTDSQLSNASVYAVCDGADGSELGAVGARELAYQLTVAADRADRLNGSSNR